MKNIFVLFLLFSLTSCNTYSIYNASEASRASDQKIISYDAKGKPWGQEIEKRLREKGFKVVKYDTKKRVSETSGGKRISYNVAESRYHLTTHGKLSKLGGRCFFRGYVFSEFTAELIDKQTNETMAYFEGDGYSEGCFPFNDHIFESSIDMVNDYWK